MPTGIYKRTEEHNKKISKSLKGKVPKFIPNVKGKVYPKEIYPNFGMRGKKHSKKSKEKIGIGNKGKIISEDTKRKISERLKGRIGRPIPEEEKKRISKGVKLFYKNCDDKFKIERGKKISESLKGKKKPIRSEEHRKKISESNKGRNTWNKGISMTEKQKEERKEIYLNPERSKKISKALRGVSRPNRQGILPKNLSYHNHYKNILSGYFNINGKNIFFRSKWEANYSLYLDFLVKQNQIIKWEYEKEVFIFEKIKFGTRSYRPDFKIYELDNTITYHEIKGYMDAKSKTKIKRMAKYYPKIKLVIIDKNIYGDIENKLGKILKFY